GFVRCLKGGRGEVGLPGGRARPADGCGRPHPRHEFVLRLAAGDLPEACFRRYLVQDYLFLMHFARAWGLAIYKSDTLAEMRRAQRPVAPTPPVGNGLPLHYCPRRGPTPAALAGPTEGFGNIRHN